MSASPPRQWTIRDVLEWTRGHFGQKGIESARLDAELLLAHTLRKDRVQLYIDYDKPLHDDELTRYRELVKRRAQRTPVAYLTGERDFWSLSFRVDPRVLIPRPETEVLIEVALERVDRRQTPTMRVLDVGTGSGILATVLAKELGASVVAVDISADALEVARQNAERHGVAERIELRQGSLVPTDGGPFDLIVSNPPYIPRADLATLMPEVSRFEPTLALDGGDDGLELIGALIVGAAQRLSVDGLLIFEFGGREQVPAIEALVATTVGLELLEIRKDYAGEPRIAVVHRP
ncbi:MAG: peptide chain release factor N(5)-glutamine methyltransferase [Myxococcales bacterium]|nr:peptide chain release factor N(5)-glutamine methyltransferase [Myxococcales bacterium]